MFCLKWLIQKTQASMCLNIFFLMDITTIPDYLLEDTNSIQIHLNNL